MSRIKSSIMIASALFASVLLFSCGEVQTDFVDSNAGTSSSLIIGNSSSSLVAENSSSSGENLACSGQNCCNGAEFDNKISFCHENQLYPLCGGKIYDPYEKGCFGGKEYDKCELPTTRGICVHNSLLRCRQEGQGETYIRDPLPGMECKPNGAIEGSAKDFRDDKVYKTVQIGNQIWLAENLNFNPGAEGNSMCLSEDPACAIYGRLYDWATALGLPPSCNGTSDGCAPQGSDLRQGLCPEPFGAARAEDWKALINYAGGSDVAGGRLKSSQTNTWNNNGIGTDNYNFNALPGGYAHYWGDAPRDIGESSYWWVDTQLQSEAYYFGIIASDTEARNHFWSKGMNLAYVRCLRY
jgi:uncharacterized protein (TIGR02145 family)